MRTIALLTLVAGCSSPPPIDGGGDAGATSPDLAPPADSCDGCTALVGAQLFDGTKKRPGTVLLRDDRIADVLVNEAPPVGAKVVDLTGKTLLPGLIDLHAHVLREPGPCQYWSATDAVDDHFKPYLRAGVTTVVDLGASEHVIFEYRARIAAGKLLGPNLLAVGAMLTPPGGHPCYAGSPPDDTCFLVDGPAAAMAALARLQPDKPDLVKIILEPGEQSWPLPRMRNDAIAAVVDGAKPLGAPVIAHVGKAGDVRDGLAAGVRLFAHVPSEDAMSPDDCKALADAHAVVVPTLAVADALFRLSTAKLDELADPAIDDDAPADLVAALQDPRYVAQMQSPLYQQFAQSLRDNAVANFKTCLAAGVTFAAGTDAGNPADLFGLSLRRELALYVENGMAPIDALHAATAGAADAVGRKDLGRLEKGALADLLVVDGDPTTDVGVLSRVVAVYRAGRAIDRAALALPKKTSLVVTPSSGLGAGATCLESTDCGAGLFCPFTDRCAATCTVGDDAACGAGSICTPQSPDGTGSDGFCYRGDGCDLFQQNCPNGAACLWIGNGATYCAYASPATAGQPCQYGSCARGLECNQSNKCGQLCNPKSPNCPNNQTCFDLTQYAGLPVGECR